MGFNLQWIAVEGKSLDVVCEELGLRRTGQFEDVPESLVTAAVLPTAWAALVIYDAELTDSELAPLSRGCRVVMCVVEEHVMYSYAEGWRDGRKEWSVTHDAQQAVTHLEISGTLPSAFASVYERLKEAQQVEDAEDAEVDYIFDVPVELADALTGFRHDAPMEPGTFEVLEPAPTPPVSKSSSNGVLGTLLSRLRGGRG